MKSCIYIVAADARYRPTTSRSSGLPVYKIGHAIDPIDRLRGLQNGSPVKLTLLHFFQIIESPYGIESEIHSLLSRYRIHGEWFALPAVTVTWLKGLNEDNYHLEITRYRNLRITSKTRVRIED